MWIALTTKEKVELEYSIKFQVNWSSSRARRTTGSWRWCKTEQTSAALKVKDAEITVPVDLQKSVIHQWSASSLCANFNSPTRIGLKTGSFKRQFLITCFMRGGNQVQNPKAPSDSPQNLHSTLKVLKNTIAVVKICRTRDPPTCTFRYKESLELPPQTANVNDLNAFFLFHFFSIRKRTCPCV